MIKDQNSKIVLKGYFKAAIICIILGLLALLAAEYLNRHVYFSHSILQLFRLISVIPAAVGVYGIKGWELQTLGGDTPTERLNNRIPQVLMGIGFVFTIFTFGLEEG